ncbi:MAG: chemotaxis protein CheX [Acidobacteria bacterium]|nr:chemotaxis protein CheX [Acidobacteriota bacterium]
MSTVATINDIGQLCGRCVPDVLETMFFAMAAESEQARAGDDALSVRVCFRGSPSGCFGLKTDRSTLSTLGAAFLGKLSEDEMTPAEVAQTACELANIVCGSVLSEAESDSGFDLDEPAIDPGAPDENGSAYSAFFELDTGGALEIHFRFAELEANPS